MSYIRLPTRRKHFRGGGSFDPSNIATIHHWWDASDISTLWEEPARTTQASQASPVGAWDDKITGISQTQANASLKPTCLIDTGRVALASDYLSAPKSLVNWAFGAGVNHHIFAISNPSSISTRAIFACAYNAWGFGLRFESSKLQAAVGDGAGGTGLANSTAAVTQGVLQLSESAFDNDNDVIQSLINNVYSGGQAAWANDVGTHASDDSCSIGGLVTGTTVGSPFIGDICEIVITEEITAGERTNLMAYFNTKYGLSLPTT